MNNNFWDVGCPINSELKLSSLVDDNFVFPDEKYLGSGLMLISKQDGETKKFMKLFYCETQGLPILAIRAYDRNYIYNKEDKKRKITFRIKENESMYNAAYKLAQMLNSNRIYSTDRFNHGRSFLQATMSATTPHFIELTVVKDLQNSHDNSDFIDITLGSILTCDYPEAIFRFYNDLMMLPEISTEDIVKKILKKD